MQTLFNQNPSASRGVVISPQWPQARYGLTRNLNQVVSYYHDRNISVRSNHLLARILNSLRVSLDATFERYYEQIDSSVAYTSMNFKLTNSIYQGVIWDGVFYGPGTREVLIGHNTPFDLYDCVRHWKDASPVTILDHNKSDLELHIPNGMAYSSETGYAVIAINITMLAVMWRCFLIEQRALMDKGLTPKTTPQFIHTYVLPNALASHLDIAIVNRLIRLVTKAPEPFVNRRQPMALGDFSLLTDKVLNLAIERLTNANLSMHDMLCNIPTVTSVNAAEAMMVPPLAPTRQYAWAEVVARVKIIAAMAALSPSSLTAYDKHNLSYITRLIDYSGMRQVIDVQMKQDSLEINQLLDSIVRIAQSS